MATAICPDCGAAIPVPVRRHQDNGTDVIVHSEQSFADVWAHMWAHELNEE